jgi:hypothetical protein
MKVLLDAGADPNLTTDDHTTPLMMAAGLNWHDISSLGSSKDSIAMIPLLLDRGVGLDEHLTGGRDSWREGDYLRFTLLGSAIPQVQVPAALEDHHDTGLFESAGA